MVDALGNLVKFMLLPGQAHDIKGVAPLIQDIYFGALLADKAFDADWLLEELDQRGAKAVIPIKESFDSSPLLAWLTPVIVRTLHE